MSLIFDRTLKLLVAGKTMPPGILQMHVTCNSRRGGAMFCMSGFKNVVFLKVYETQTSIILYVMCKAQPPGVHQAAHDGPDGGWQGASMCTLDYRNLQKPSTLNGVSNVQI